MLFPIRQYTQPQTQHQTQPTTNNSIESPFDPFQPDSSSSTFAIYIEPIRNAYYKTYQHVITFDALPAGPLANMVISINTASLSEFQRSTAFASPYAAPPTRTGGRCIYVLSRYPKGSPHANPKHSNAYMSPRDIPSLYGFLRTNGYAIDTTLTKMTYQTNTASYMMMDDANGYGQRKLVAISTYTK